MKLQIYIVFQNDTKHSFIRNEEIHFLHCEMLQLLCLLQAEFYVILLIQYAQNKGKVCSAAVRLATYSALPQIFCQSVSEQVTAKLLVTY